CRMSGCEQQSSGPDANHRLAEAPIVCSAIEGNKVCGAQIMSALVLQGTCLLNAPESNQMAIGFPENES
ncbi:MAG TPA: hypothetical protein VGO07_06010, partial [Candidatus Saccharimonadales bacterium]|nr:hypothetical protein [Candidatus Saccharimonadales bacterium]